MRVSPSCDDKSYECAIAVDPVQPWNLVAVAKDKSGTACGAFWGRDGIFHSSDAGNTWVNATNGIVATGTPWGDQNVAYDRNGNAVCGSIMNTGCGGTGECAIGTFTSADGGATWNTYAALGGGTNTEAKPWVTCDQDPSSPYSGRFYVGWDRYTSSETNVCCASTDAGTTWSAFVPVRADMEFATTAVGAGGRLLSVGVDDTTYQTMHSCVSTDGGQTFSCSLAYTYVATAGFPSHPLTYTGVAPQNMLNPGLDVDRAFGSNGRAYLAVMDKRAGQSFYHLWVTHSDDGGVTWSAPTQADDDLADTHEHAFPWLCVSPSGSVHVFYFDFRCPPSNQTTPYARYSVGSSTDNGATWHHMQLCDTTYPWTTDGSQPSWPGDYEGGAATNRLIYGYWSDSRDGLVRKSYAQAVPNPMPWISTLGPTVNAGGSATITIGGGALVPTVTPFAIVFDDPGITGTLGAISNTSINVAVSVSMSVPGGPHEWSLQYGVAVGSVTVVASLKSGCVAALNVIAPTSTATPKGTPTKTATPYLQVKVAPNPVALQAGNAVHFYTLANAVISIYTLAGEHVFSTLADSYGHAVWPLMTDGGKTVARGLYGYVASLDEQRTPGTLAVL